MVTWNAEKKPENRKIGYLRRPENTKKNNSINKIPVLWELYRIFSFPSISFALVSKTFLTLKQTKKRKNWKRYAGINSNPNPRLEVDF